MKFKKIVNKQKYLHENYLFVNKPKLTDEKYCFHCGKRFVVGDYKVVIIDEMEYITCPNYEECGGSLIDWVDEDPNQ